VGIDVPQTENQIQEAVWAYLASVKIPGGRTLQDVSFHVPNGIQLAGGSPKRRAIYMAALKRRGLRPGVQDLIILCPHPHYGWNGMLLELKTRDGSESAEQSQFRNLMVDMGYYAVVGRGYEQAVSRIQEYMEHM
jgi:hypothetical protein